MRPILRRMPTSPGPLLLALQRLWERLRRDVPDLPPVIPAVSSNRRRTDHSASRWSRDEEGAVTGLVVTADVLQEGPEAVLEMVLHDAAHILNWVRNVPDTATRGVYHNGAFLVAAEEVGLEWTDSSDRVPGKGYANPTISAAALERHREDVAALSAAIDVTLPHLEVPTTTSRTNRLTLRCNCDPPRTFRISRTIAAQGPIVCGICNSPFA